MLLTISSLIAGFRTNQPDDLPGELTSDIPNGPIRLRRRGTPVTRLSRYSRLQDWPGSAVTGQDGS